MLDCSITVYILHRLLLRQKRCIPLLSVIFYASPMTSWNRIQQHLGACVAIQHLNNVSSMHTHLHILYWYHIYLIFCRSAYEALFTYYFLTLYNAYLFSPAAAEMCICFTTAVLHYLHGLGDMFMAVNAYIYSFICEGCLLHNSCSLGAIKQVREKVDMDAGEPAVQWKPLRIYFSSVRPHSWLHLLRWKHDRHTVAYSYKNSNDEVLFICFCK